MNSGSNRAWYGPGRRLVSYAVPAFAAGLVLLGLAAHARAAAQDSPAARPLAGTIARFDPALDRLIAPEAKVELLASGFGPTEGPIWRDHELWISDMLNDKTIAIAMNGKTSVVASRSGGGVAPVQGLLLGPNGMLPYQDGVLICRQGTRDIAFFRGKKFTSVLSTYQGKRLNSPNDMVLAADGALWFTDPAFSVPGGAAGPEPDLPFEGVYRYHNGVLKAVITDLVRPNGIAFSPDGRTLYVSTGFPAQNRIRAYTVGSNGALSNPRDFKTFADNAPGDKSVPMDGMKVDEHGNLWASGPGGLNIITPEGKILGQIRVSGQTTANLVFGGPDGKTLFIVGGSEVYRIPVLVHGKGQPKVSGPGLVLRGRTGS